MLYLTDLGRPLLAPRRRWNLNALDKLRQSIEWAKENPEHDQIV